MGTNIDGRGSMNLSHIAQQRVDKSDVHRMEKGSSVHGVSGSKKSWVRFPSIFKRFI